MEALPDSESQSIKTAAHPRYGYALSEGLLMASRDGNHFKRWNEAFLRPGPARPETLWRSFHRLGIDRNRCYASRSRQGIIAVCIRRLLAWPRQRSEALPLRLDGFVSVSASWNGGALLTKPLIFDGSQLGFLLHFRGWKLAGGTSIRERSTHPGILA